MMHLNEKYQKLFTTDKRYIIVTGGRGSSKSFSVSTFLTLLTYEIGHKILFTRYTMVSAEMSIIPEFKEKIDMLNAELIFKVGQHNITNAQSGSEILFKGIKTSSGIQTASLKSLQGITTWVVDEAEELPDQETFDKIDLSIRHKDVQNRVILIMNPTNRDHWIWKKFFSKSHTIENIAGYDVPVSTHPDVCHIHTTYLDNINNLSPSFIDIINKIKTDDKKRYHSEIIGGWKLQLDGTLFERDKIKRYSRKDFKLDGLQSILGYIDVADEGTDSFAFPVGYVFDGKVFITDILFTKDNIDITQPLTISMINKHKFDYVRVEANNQGSVFIKNLRNAVSSDKILSVTNSNNKHTRIILNYLFIKDYFYFLNDDEIEQGSDYDLFMRQIFDYMKEKGATKDDDDAPDSLSGLAEFIQSFLPHLFK